jgi:hypothetical protein
MNSQNLIRPVRSLPRSRSQSIARFTHLPAAELLRTVLQPGAAEGPRCAGNIVVYGGHKPVADEFAAAAVAYLSPLDSLWRVGAGESADSSVVWVDPEDQLLTMLTATILFLPGGAQYEEIAQEWQDRADVLLVGSSEWGADPERYGALTTVWKWGPVCLLLHNPAPVPAFAPQERPVMHMGARIAIPLVIAHGRVEPPTAEERYTAFQSECWSPDARVRATVQGTPGGELSVVFVTNDLELERYEVQFAFRKSRDGVLEGRKQLWKDEGDPTRLAAFWFGSQLNLRGAERSGSEGPGEPQLTFEFEVLPPPPAEQTSAET